MSRFEDILRRSLRREEAPPGFAERVLARTAASPSVGFWEELRAAFRPVPVRWAAVIALALVFGMGLRYNAERQRRAEGEAAKAQVLMAIRITAEKLEFTRQKVVNLTSGSASRRDRGDAGGSTRRLSGSRI